MAIVGYSLCSSTLLLANKMTMAYLPIPAVVSFIQIFSSAAFILLYKLMGGTVDAIEWPKVKAYSLYIVAFVAAIYANMQALNHSNVETVIVFRACSPIAVTIVEYFFMDRAWPSLRSTMSLVVVAMGAICYCMSDSQFNLEGPSAYYWVMTYFVLITFEMTYGKRLTSSVKMESVWGPVLYCNLLAAGPMFMIGWVNGDFENIQEKLSEIPANGVMLLIFSCIAGTMIG
jgi:drug/metabolite transporter (DMT)-like permease